MEDFNYLASKNSIQELVTTLEKTREIVIKQRLSNIVIYDIAKMEAILFLSTWNKKVNKEIEKIQLIIGEEEIKFNNQVT